MLTQAISIIIILLLIPSCVGKESATPVMRGEIHPVDIEKGDRCPVCGMYVKDYKNWAGEMFLEGGRLKKFDDPGCAIIYYHRLSNKGEVKRIFLKDYYTQEWIDGMKAHYVTQARISTPMGYGLVPFKKREKAEAFRADHHSVDMMTFQQVLQNMERIGLE